MAELEISGGNPELSSLLRLAPETRVRIYRHYFQHAVVRFTRPRKGKARVYAKTKISLLVICKTVFLEAHPFYTSSVKLVLNNARISHLMASKLHSPLRHLQHLELVDDLRTPLDVSDLPALKTLKLSAPPQARGWLFFADPRSHDDIDQALTGSQDETLKNSAFRLAARNYSYLLGSVTGRIAFRDGWFSSLIKSSTRAFRIIDTIPVRYPPRHYHYRNPALRSRVRGIHLIIEYDVDTMETVGRSLYESKKHIVSVWEEGKLDVYQLLKDGKAGKLLESEVVEHDEVHGLTEPLGQHSSKDGIMEAIS